MSRALAALAASLLLALSAVGGAGASPDLKIGIFDEAQTLFGNPDESFPVLARLRTQVLRVNLYWDRVAPFQPAEPANPASDAYDWDVYDRTALYAQQHGIQLVFSIFGTPEWANGGKGRNYAPSKMTYLRAFALAAARRYSGSYAREEGTVLPKVDMWLAWNEPNLPAFLLPQWRKSGGRYVIASAATYARMCNAIWRGVHAAGREAKIEETVGCGVTSPRGNNIASGARASVSPLAFLRAMSAAGAKFDVYAHHPYAPTRLESPSTRPRARTTVSLGNIDVLFAELNRLYGKRMRLWITEYGYQTNPPDRLFGVSWRKQAQYLKEAYAIARAHSRIDMLLWFLLRDEPDLSGWQSGLFSAAGEQKPAFAAFRNLPR